MGVVEVPVAANGLQVVCLLDEDDVEQLGARRLSLGSHGYVQMWSKPNVMLLHRWVLGLQRGDRRIGDHINGDPLDNRRINLRIVSASGSSQNVAGRGKSSCRGVAPTRAGKWTAKVKFQGQAHHLGTYDTEAEAALAADAKRRELMPDYIGLRAAVSAIHRDKRTAGTRAAVRDQAKKIRDWGRRNGFDVPEVGRICGSLRKAYFDANPDGI